MNIKKIVIGGVLLIIGLPVALIAVALAWFLMEGKTNGAIVTSGQTRKYLLYVPKTYDRSKPTPLLISLHPAPARPEIEMEISRWNDLSDEHGFIVVYPSGSDFPKGLAHGATESGMGRQIHFRFDRQAGR